MKIYLNKASKQFIWHAPIINYHYFLTKNIDSRIWTKIWQRIRDETIEKCDRERWWKKDVYCSWITYNKWAMGLIKTESYQDS